MAIIFGRTRVAGQPRRWRYRLRTSMIAVAAVACILGVFVSVRHRAERFRLLAAYHREQYDELRSAIPFPGEEAYYAMTRSEFQQLPKRVVVQMPPSANGTCR